LNPLEQVEQRQVDLHRAAPARWSRSTALIWLIAPIL
jgi:hypothetical protein